MGLLVKSTAGNKLCKTKSILAVSTPFGFPDGSVVKNPPGNAENAYLIPGFKGMIPWRRAWQPTPVFMPGKYRGQRSPGGYSPRGRKKSQTQFGS